MFNGSIVEEVRSERQEQKKTANLFKRNIPETTTISKALNRLSLLKKKITLIWHSGIVRNILTLSTTIHVNIQFLEVNLQRNHTKIVCDI